MTSTRLKSTGMQQRTPKPGFLGLFWFGIQVVWGALLGISLQARALELGGSHAIAAYSVLAAAGAAVAAVTQVLVGVISDRRRQRGSRRTEFYVAGSVIAAAALIWFYSAPTFAQLVAAVLLLQVAMNVAIGPYQAVIPDFIRDEHLGTAAAWMAALQSLGNATGALLAALVANTRVVAISIAAILLATAGASVAHVRTLSLLPAKAQPVRVSRAFVDLFISRALVFLGFYTLLGYLFFFVRLSLGGNTKTTTGALILVVTISAAIGALLAAKPANRIDRRAIATVGGLGFVLGLCGFLASHALLPIAASALLAGGAWGVFITADWTLGCQFLPRFALATAMGIWNLALLIPQIAAPVIAAAVLSWMHALQSANAPRIAFIIAACEVICGVAWIWRLPASTASSVESIATGNTP